MKIKELDGTIVDVFAVYWFDDETYFYGLPIGYGNFIAYRNSRVTVVDPSLYGNFVYYNQGVFHRALIQEKLLDDILERDENAYNRFLKIIKSEGLVAPDFY